MEWKMSRADYSLTDKEIAYSMHVSQPTVSKYRKIYQSKPFLGLQDDSSTVIDGEVTEEKP
jgi:predicted transcriptional regulator